MEVKTQVKNENLIRKKHLQIAQAATPLFIKKGFHQTSIREIAEAANISPGLLYKYISSKDDVLFLVYKDFYEQYLNSVSSPKIQKAKNPFEKLEASMEAMLKLFQTDPAKFLFLYTESKFLNSSAIKSILSMETKLIEYLENILEEGVRNCMFDVKDSYLTANIILYLLMMDPMRGWAYRKRNSPSFVQKTLINFCMRAINREENLADPSKGRRKKQCCSK